VHVLDRGQDLGEALGLALDDLVELEMIWRDDLCRRLGARADEVGNARLDEHAAVAIADDRIAAIGRLRVGGLHFADRGEDRFAHSDRSHIA
jgi:hypothetical protein